MHLLLTPCHFECCFGAKGQSSSPVQQCSPVVKSGDCKHISSFYFSEWIAKSLYSSKNRLGCKEQSTIVLFELKHVFIHYSLCLVPDLALLVCTPASQGKAVVYCSAWSVCLGVLCI